MSEFRHFLLTRFNVRIPWLKAGRPAHMPDAWVDRRFVLFLQYCLPSVRHQTSSDFQWLIYFDTNTPERHRQQIDQLRRQFPFEPVFIDLLDSQTITETIRTRIEPACEYVITSRLDSDDVLAPSFVETVQSVFNRQTFQFVDFPRGYKIQDDKLYLASWKNNPFYSLIEKSANPVATSFPHPEIDKHGPVLYHPRRTWLQVLHDTNVESLRAPGLRTRNCTFLSRFGFDVGLPPDSMTEIAMHNARYLGQRTLGKHWRWLKKRLGLYRPKSQAS